MNYLVIGEPCVDLIHTAKGDILHSYGGILYSVISLAVLAGKEDSVYPIMNVGNDEYENILNILKNYRNISTEGITAVSHPTRKVNLFYNDYNSGKSARIERSTEPTYTIPYESIEKYIPLADAVLINMISGVDITLDTLKSIRANYRGFVHIDIHNLVMKTNEDGTRTHTHLENWRDWCTNTDTVQMNEFEMEIMPPEKKNEYEVAEEILINLNKEMTGIIVTRGKDGISGFTRKEKTFGSEKFFDIDRHDISAVENPKFIDSTGCGDVFASSFTLDYSKNKNFRISLHYATRIASFKTSIGGLDELHKLK